ncbi:MAG: amidohydrolase family protein [Marinicellaceae bacterium]
MKKIVLTLLLGSSMAHSLTLHCGNMLDVNSGKMLTNIYVKTNNGKFEVIEKFNNQPIDLDFSKQYCLPGLIDMHTHLSFEYSKNRYSDKYQLNEADYAFDSVLYAKRTLEAGFTTVRDLGDVFNVTIALKKAINKGTIQGPRIFTVGKSLATTGGHADPSNGYRQGLLPNPGPKNGVVNGVAEAAQAVRQRYQDGADLIKITATGGVLSQASSGDNAQFNEQELESIVATASDYGFKVAAHAHGKEGMKRAIIAGVASIEHGTYSDNEIIDLMKKHGTYLVPTLIAGEWVTQKSQIKDFFPEVVAKKAATIGPLIAQSFENAHKAGVNIAFGTDSGVSAHGDNGKEFALMVMSGMSEIEAIQSATVNAALLLGQDKKLGSIEKGKLADLIVVSKNPLLEIEVLEEIQTVIKAGIIEFQ